jgi:hypothetical protein
MLMAGLDGITDQMLLASQDPDSAIKKIGPLVDRIDGTVAKVKNSTLDQLRCPIRQDIAQLQSTMAAFGQDYDRLRLRGYLRCAAALTWARHRFKLKKHDKIFPTTFFDRNTFRKFVVSDSCTRRCIILG